MSDALDAIRGVRDALRDLRTDTGCDYWSTVGGDNLEKWEVSLTNALTKLEAPEERAFLEAAEALAEHRSPAVVALHDDSNTLLHHHVHGRLIDGLDEAYRALLASRGRDAAKEGT